MQVQPAFVVCRPTPDKIFSAASRMKQAITKLGLFFYTITFSKWQDSIL